MRIDIYPDAEFISLEHFSMSIKNGKLYFSVGNDKHVIGSKVYPIGKKTGIFSQVDSNEKGDYKEVADTIERSKWVHKDGFCYTNAEILHKTFLAHEIDAKYYSGWVFTSANYPIHHAWVVVDDRVYDISVHEKSQEKLLEQSVNGVDPYSIESVKEVKAIKDVIYPIRDNFVWGKTPTHMIYVGAENTPTGARLQYNSCMDKFPSHPSYPNRPTGEKHYRNRYQSIMDEL